MFKPSPRGNLCSTRSFRRWREIIPAWILALCAVVAAFPAAAQEDEDDLGFPDVPVSNIGKSLSEPVTVNPTSGIDGRIGYWAMPSFGRNTGIAPLELFPYVMFGDQILFGDIRGFVSNDGLLGGNFGAGWRFVDPTDMFLFGLNGWYDVDDTTGALFHQLGFGGEVRMEQGGLAANAYFPVGNQDQIIDQSLSNVHFSENQILFDVNSRLGAAMRGLDLRINAYLPTDFCRDRQVQVTGGWYHFEGDNAETINGYLVQLDGEIYRSIHGQVLTTHDKVFGTNVTLGLHWRFGTSDPPETDLRGQMRRFVERNYNIIVDTRRDMLHDVVAINPETGNAYRVAHIDGTTDGSGTPDDPFATVAEGQADGADVLFVHSGTTLSESIVLSDDQYLIGEGSSGKLRDNRFGKFSLPGDSTGPGPVIDNSPGHGVVMGNRSILSGFSIFGAGGDGIVATDVDDIVITDVQVEGSTGNGVTITGGSGALISDLTILHAGGHGLVLDGVTEAEVDNLIVDGTGGDGLRLVNIDDVLEVDTTTIRNAGDNGIHVVGGHGEIGFGGLTRIEDSGLAGFAITGLETVEETDDQGTTTTYDDETTTTQGVVQIDKLEIVGNNSDGISVTDSDGFMYVAKATVDVTNGSAIVMRNSDWLGIASGTFSSTNAPVIDVEDSNVTFTLTRILADGGPSGIRMINTDGSIAVLGTSSDEDDDDDIGIGGLIQNTNTAVVMQDSGSLGLQGVNFKDNAVVAQAHNSSTFQIIGSQITGTSTQLVDALNVNLMTITQSLFVDNSLASGSGIVFAANADGSYSMSFQQNQVEETTGTFLTAETRDGVTGAKLVASIQSNSIELGQAMDVATLFDWTGVMQGVIAGNVIVGEDSNQTAIQYIAGESTSLSQLVVQQNAIALGGSSSTGIDIVSNAPSTVQILANEIVLNGSDGVGVDATFYKAVGFSMISNSITDNGGGGTGLLLPTVYEGSALAISGNTINLASTSSFIDRGIVLSNILGDGDDDPFVTFSSSASNTITGASTTLSVPSSGVNGQLIINDVIID